MDVCSDSIEACKQNVKLANGRTTSIDVLPFKNQAICEFCTRVNQLKHC